MTVSEYISQVRSFTIQKYDDDNISDRLIYGIGRNVCSTLVKREINQRRLLNSDNIFIPIECLDLELVNLNKCGIECSGMARRSRFQLPMLEEGIFGYTIQGIYNIDNSEEVYPTTLRSFINISKLRRKPKKNLYLIKDRYLYILNPDIENVNVYLYSPDDSFLLSECQSMYDANFKLPGYLHDSLFSMTNAKLMTYLQLPQDVTDDNLDEKTVKN